MSATQGSREIIYAYPTRVVTSFSLVARKHIEYLRRFYTVREVDELAALNQQAKTMILHPAQNILINLPAIDPPQGGMMIMSTYEYYRILAVMQLHEKLREIDMIAFEVCDSDAISRQLADNINIYIDKVAVPSAYCVNVFRSSGVRTKIYHIPHAVDREWYELPNVWNSGLKEKIKNPQLLLLYEYKKKTGKKILLFWQWYSTPRKGWNEVVEVYKRLRKERDDVILVVKTGDPGLRELNDLRGMEYINVYGWLSDIEKIALYDLADATLLFSRGGAFEINCLESLARGVPCLAHDAGPWAEYNHPMFFIKHGKKIKVFDNNPIHIGFGYTVHIDHAIAKINDVLNNTDIYKEIAEEHRQKLKEKFTWDHVGEMIVKMIEE